MTGDPTFPNDPQVNEPKFWLLVSPWYIFALGVLLLNDFVLKTAWPGVVTGKLSDFAGLFALGVFLLVLTRRPASLLGLAVCFVVWKLSISEAMIRAWNSVTGLTIGRTVDPTDLVALTVLPLASLYHGSIHNGRAIRRGWITVSAAASLFAFTATTAKQSPEQRAAYHAAIAEFTFPTDQPSYHFPLTRKQIYQALEARRFMVSGGLSVTPDPGQHFAYLVPREAHTLTKNSDTPALWGAEINVDNAGDGITLRLSNVTIKRNGREITRADAVRIFEAKVIAPLR